MRGLSSSTKSRIFELVDDMFDRMSLNLIGEVPSLRGKKSILFTTRPDFTLAHLFLKTLGTTNPMPAEVEAMKSLLSTAEEYISALRSRTKAQVTDQVEAYIRETRMQKQNPSTVDMKKIINENFNKAKNHFQTISEAEATKARNMGKALQIGKVAASQGISDPSIFFIVLKDNATCKHCLSAHLMPDMMTPKVYKLSEVKFGYLSKDERGKKVSISGQHPRCRCSMSFLANSFGFKDGGVSYISPDHDEYRKQRGQQ